MTGGFGGGVFERAAEGLDGAKRRVRDSLHSSMNAVCLVTILLLEVLHRFVSYGFNTAFAVDCIFSALITSMTSLLTFYVFFPSGKAQRRSLPSFTEAQEALQSARSTLRERGGIGAFRRFCRERAERECGALLALRLEELEALGVTREDFAAYRSKSRRALRRLVREGVISREAFSALRRCLRPARCRPYSPAYFLADVREGQENIYLRGKDHYQRRTLTLRPLLCIAMGVVTSLFTWTPKQPGSTLDVLLCIAISVFQICLAAMSGYSSGVTAAQREEQALLAKHGFLTEFLEMG